MIESSAVPQLRFPEFDDEWQRISLESISGKGQYGMNSAAQQYDGVNKYLRITDIDESTNRLISKKLTSPSDKLDDQYLVKESDLLLTRTGASTGKSYLYDKVDGKMYFAGFLIKFHINNADPYFVFTQTLRFNYQKWVTTISTRSGQPGINADEYGKFSFLVPVIEEQQKVTGFLTLVDAKIAAIDQKVELLKQYKKGVMQKIFTQQIRFKDKDGRSHPEWKVRKLSDIFDRINYKNSDNNQNILTISAQQGLVSQTDYFNKIVASKNITNYYLLQRDDFAYNKSYSAGYPVGAIKRLKYYDKGVVSTLYICFRAKDNRDVDFFEHFFEFGIQNPEIEKVAQEGARNHGLLNIAVGDFFNIELKIPVNKDEQQKIAESLTTIDDKIKAEESKLIAAKKFKSALLQRMFV